MSIILNKKRTRCVTDYARKIPQSFVIIKIQMMQETDVDITGKARMMSKMVEMWRVTLEWNELNHPVFIQEKSPDGYVEGTRVYFRRGKAIANIEGDIEITNDKKDECYVATLTLKDGTKIPLHLVSWEIKC